MATKPQQSISPSVQSSSSPLPIVWSIAGTDPIAGAGIQADLKTFQGLGVYGCTVITAVVAQNTVGVQKVECLTAPIIEAQLKSLSDDAPASAIKIGMLGSADTVRLVARALAGQTAKVVCDPVFAATCGSALLADDSLGAFKAELLPRVNMLTPNIHETEKLLGRSVRNCADMENAARDLLALGPKCVLVKGGHLTGDLSQDYWTNGKQSAWLSSPRINTKHTHGGGCTLSSAIAAAYALEFGGLDAIVIAKAYVNQGLRNAGGVGKGRGPLAHKGWPESPDDLPWITPAAEPAQHRLKFPAEEKMGLYPIVDRADWLEKLLPLGVDMIQLRVKDLQGDALEKEIARGVDLARRFKARLYINDHWQLALKHHAYGVHIGQDDLPTTDVGALQRAGLRLGVSTHGYAEIARALAVLPSYVAIGTLFESPSKSFKQSPLGIPAFQRMRKLVGVPVVAIGGITLEQAQDVLAAGADGLAVISDLTKATDLAGRVRQWREIL